MNDEVKQALAKDGTDWDRTIDITTTGRKSGKSLRVEIWFHNVEDHIYITGTPGTRGWLANMISTPEFTFHMKHNAKADLPARARPIFDLDERQRIMGEITGRIGESKNLNDWVSSAPLIEVALLPE